MTEQYELDEQTAAEAAESSPIDAGSIAASDEFYDSLADESGVTLSPNLVERDDIWLAERAHQASICVDWRDVNEDERNQCAADLAEALDLRVEVNRAQHDGGDVRRVGHTDPRVRELEAPWTRKARRAAGSTIPNQEGQS